MPTEPLFTPAQVKSDAANAVVRTTGQAGAAAALVGLGAALCRWRGWLHGDLDSLGFGYWTTLVTIGTASVSNLGKLRGRS